MSLPKEPTEAMIEAGAAVFKPMLGGPGTKVWAAQIWRVMYEAALQPLSTNAENALQVKGNGG